MMAAPRKKPELTNIRDFVTAPHGKLRHNQTRSGPPRETGAMKSGLLNPPLDVSSPSPQRARCHDVRPRFAHIGKKHIPGRNRQRHPQLVNSSNNLLQTAFRNRL